ncbi:lectin subunit alpha-like [Musca domestica]|uniref:Lectin subunit alpha-like n=1 Tax=Musca domestica TaxID=7370 RepID=A0A1I8M8S8_MUSDO|nr:lectin subunit alpha-like [Musca domestica]
MKSVTVIAIAFCMAAVALESVRAVPTLQRGFDGGVFYIEIDQNYNWFEAAHECARKGLQLLEIPDGNKNAVVVDALKSYVGNPRDFWLGANDEYNRVKDPNRPFYWSSKGGRVNYSNFAKGEPNNMNSNEHCLHLLANAAGFQWNDKDCAAKHGFICEAKA